MIRINAADILKRASDKVIKIIYRKMVEKWSQTQSGPEELSASGKRFINDLEIEMWERRDAYHRKHPL